MKNRRYAFAMTALVFGALMSAPSQAQESPKIRILTEQEIEDMVIGTGIQATRNSDNDGLMKQAKAMLAKGLQFRLIAAKDIPDNWTIVNAAGGIAGGGAWDYVTERTNKQNLPRVENATVLAMNALSKHVGKKFDAVMRNEAAQATLFAFQNAALAGGLPVVDACPAGRAKPDVQISVSFVNGLSVTPAALVTRWGDTIILDKTVDDYRYEDIARAIAVGSGGSVSQARGVFSGADVKAKTIPGAISEAILFGKTVREAAAKGADPVAALMKVAGGYPLFRGTVTKAEEKGERGYNWWNVEIAGIGAYSGHTYKIYVKNENIAAWLDGKPDAMSPDLIYDLDPKTGKAIGGASDGGYTVGQEVFMMGRPANSPAWRTPKGIEVAGPRHFGFDFDYVPLETILKNRPKMGM